MAIHVASREPTREYSNNGGLLPGFTVYSPGKWLPHFYRPRFLADFIERQRFHQARRLLLKRGCRTVILYIWRSQFASALDVATYDLSCYHIADEYSFSDNEIPLDETERRLIAGVDQVIITSLGLLDKKGSINPQTLLVPNGVDFKSYAKPLPEPLDLKPIPHPRIGYTGRIKSTLDWQLLYDLSSRHCRWQFVFVGPHYPNHPEALKAVQELSHRTNVHFLGSKAVTELPGYPQHFDVCIMPYRVDSHSGKFGYPLKLHEYLASGRPVVGSPLRSLQEFYSVIKLAGTVDEWSGALEDSLSLPANSAQQVEARRSVAREHDWNKLVGLIARTMCNRLGPEYLERFEEISICEPALPLITTGLQAAE